MSITITRQMSVEEINLALRQLPAAGKTFNASKHCGVLKLREDPLQYQKRVRDEWD